jgi:hypothetical protein
MYVYFYAYFWIYGNIYTKNRKNIPVFILSAHFCGTLKSVAFNPFNPGRSKKGLSAPFYPHVCFMAVILYSLSGQDTSECEVKNKTPFSLD